MDKRIKKTRSAVYTAVFDLSVEKELDKITVLELCQKAGINKSTFYLHYKSIEDCFQKCFAYFTKKILKLTEDIDYSEMSYSPENTISKILDAVEENIIFFDKYKNSYFYDSSVRLLKEKLVEAICKENKINKKDNYHQVAKVTFLVGGCFDAVVQMLPYFDRDELTNIMVNVIKRK